MRILIVVAGLFVLAEHAEAQSCVPDCRAGYACNGGVCVAVAGPDPFLAVVPDGPPSPPRYEIEFTTNLASLFHGKSVSAGDEVFTEETTVYGRRSLAIGGRVLIREGGNAWLSVEAAYAMTGRAVYSGTGSSNSGDGSGAVFTVEQVVRIPITEPGWALLLDRKVALDLSVGGFYGTAGGDLGGCAAARASFFWLNAGPTLYFGRRSGLGVGLAIGARASF